MEEKKTIANKVNNRLRAAITADGHILEKFSVKYKSNKAGGKYQVSAKIKFNDVQTVCIAANAYSGSDEDVISRIMADIESNFKLYKGSSERLRSIMQHTVKNVIQTGINEKFQDSPFSIEITNSGMMQLVFGEMSSKCSEICDIGDDIRKIADKAEVVWIKEHRFFNGGVSEIKVNISDVDCIIEKKRQEIQKNDIVVSTQKGKAKIQNHYKEADKKISEIAALLTQTYDSLYIGRPKEFSIEETMIVNFGRKEVRCKFFNASMTFDMVTGNVKSIQNDDIERLGNLYLSSQELIKKLETMLSEEKAHISVLPKSGIGILETGQTEITVQYKRYNKKVSLTLPGVNNKELWMKQVYDVIERSVKELQAEEAATLKNISESYLMAAIYSVVSQNNNHIPMTKIVDILRGTNGHNELGAGQFNFYSQDEIKAAINKMVLEGIVSARDVNGEYRNYKVYKVKRADWAPAPLLKITKKCIEPLLTEHRKMTDVMSSAVISYYQKRKRISIQEYMVILRCVSDYILVTQTEKIAELCSDCPQEIRDMLEIIIDTEENRQLKKAYKTIVGTLKR